MKLSTQETPAQGHRVLVVDDDAQVRSIVRRFLEPEGYEIAEAESVEAAKEKLGAERFDVVLTDLTMAGSLDGIDLAALVHREFPETETILMTGFPDIQASIRAIRAGVLDFLIKPIARESLVNVVGRWSRERALREALQDANAVLESCVAGLLGTLENLNRDELVGAARLKVEQVIAQARQLDVLAASLKSAAKRDGSGKTGPIDDSGGNRNG